MLRCWEPLLGGWEDKYIDIHFRILRDIRKTQEQTKECDTNIVTGCAGNDDANNAFHNNKAKNKMTNQQTHSRDNVRS